MPDAPPADASTIPPPAAFKEFVPVDYHDRGYLKDLLDKPQGAETTAELFKRLDGAQKLIGQKSVGIPGADAKPEDVDAFLAKLRPEKADAYDFKALGEGSDKELLAVLRESFHHAGNSPAQVSRFLEKFAPVFAERAKTAAAEQKKMDDAFDGLVAQAFGADNAKVMEVVNGALKDHTPEPLRPFLGKISNENLAIMSGVIHSIIKKYGVEDKIIPSGGGAGGSGGDTAALQAELSAIVAQPAYRDEFSPAHAETRAKADALAKKIAALK